MLRRGKRAGTLDRWLLALGMSLIAICAGAQIHGMVSSTLALREFDRAQAASTPVVPPAPELEEPGVADVRHWSEQRVRAYRDSRTAQQGRAIAVLRLVRLNIRIPVFTGTGELTLNRGVGWIEGTARPGEAGNVGIAGHRDGFFRRLKDLSRGDAIELVTASGTAVYTVDRIEIVSPGNTSVLRPRETPSLTLVTCYPFYFMGAAPKRFVLHAALKDPASGAAGDRNPVRQIAR